MGSNTRAFNAVFDRAQEILKDTFGMEIVELMSKADRDSNEKPQAEEGKKKAAGGTKSYILRSVLDSELIEAANASHADINREENAVRQDDDGDFTEDNVPKEDTILAWGRSDHIGSVGFLAVVLALILVNNKELEDSERSFLSTAAYLSN
jgi:hypothetical protein